MKINIRSILGGFIGSVVIVTALLAVVLGGTETQPPIYQDNLSIIWPEDGATLTGEYEFFAYLEDRTLDSYDTYIYVDDGLGQKLEDSFDEMPHKKITVDTALWNQEKADHVIKFVTTKKNQPAEILAIKNISVQDKRNKSVSFNYRTLLSSVLDSVEERSVVDATASDIVFDWSNEGTVDDYDQLFTLAIKDFLPADYYAFWQVGKGSYKRMYEKKAGDNFVFAHINFNSWNWRGDGPYDLHFIVQDKETADEIGRKTIQVNRYTVDGVSYVATHEKNVVLPEKKQVAVVVEEMPLEAEKEELFEPEEVNVVEEESVLKEVEVAPELPLEEVSEVAPEVIVVESTATEAGGEEVESLIVSPDVSEEVLGSYTLEEKALYVAPNESIRRFNQSDNKVSKTLLGFIAEKPQAVWLTGGDSDIRTLTQVGAKVSAAEVPVFVLYNIPNRDCGGLSSGGADSKSAYIKWIKDLVEAVGTTEAVFIVEPDALTHISCLKPDKQTERLSLLNETVKIFKEKTASRVYIDAGHPYWFSVTKVTDMLLQAGVEQSDGFSLNTSNYITTAENITYGQNIIRRLATKGKGLGFVIDTSRNGNGPTSVREWCNPSGRALGQDPQFLPGDKYVDAYLWIKHPGESDGKCNGGPSAGSWWSTQAFDMVINMLKNEADK